MKRITERSETRVSVYHVMKGDKSVASVQILRTKTGTVYADVYDGKGNLIHQGKAGGGGHNKERAALSGAEIDGIKIYDNAVPVDSWKKGTKAPVGTELSNGDNDCHYISGLRRLEAFGYKVYELM